MNKKVLLFLLCLVSCVRAMEKSFTIERFFNTDKYSADNFFTFEKKPIKIYGVSGRGIPADEKKIATMRVQSLRQEDISFENVVNTYRGALKEQYQGPMAFVHFDHKTNQLHCACVQDSVIFIENNGKVRKVIECGSSDGMGRQAELGVIKHETVSLSDKTLHIIMATPGFTKAQEMIFIQKFKKNIKPLNIFVYEHPLAKLSIFRLNWQDKRAEKEVPVNYEYKSSILGGGTIDIGNKVGEDEEEILQKIENMDQGEFINFLAETFPEELHVDDEQGQKKALHVEDASYLSQMQDWWNKQSVRAKAAAALSVAAIFGGLYYYTHTR